MSLLLARLTTGTVVAAGTGQATWTGLAPTVLTPVTLLPGVGAATWAGVAPTVTVAVVVVPDVGQATWTGLAPTILNPAGVTAGVGAATWTGLAPTIQIAIVVAPGVGAAVWAGLAPTVVATANQLIQPGVGQAVWSGLSPLTQPLVVVGGGKKRAEHPTRHRHPIQHPRYLQPVEDVVVRPGTGRLRARGFAPLVAITNIQSEDRLLLTLAAQDEDVILALSLADAWMN